MKLNDWLDAVPGRATQMAAHFGITQSAVTQWRAGVPKGRMWEVMEFTGGEVGLEDMVPSSPSRLATAEQRAA